MQAHKVGLQLSQPSLPFLSVRRFQREIEKQHPEEGRGETLSTPQGAVDEIEMSGVFSAAAADVLAPGSTRGL